MKCERKKMQINKGESLQFSIHDGRAIVVFGSRSICVFKLFAVGDIGFILKF
jgi:hypothetical protein